MNYQGWKPKFRSMDMQIVYGNYKVSLSALRTGLDRGTILRGTGPEAGALSGKEVLWMFLGQFKSAYLVQKNVWGCFKATVLLAALQYLYTFVHSLCISRERIFPLKQNKLFKL